jgi:hypothetical protein
MRERQWDKQNGWMIPKNTKKAACITELGLVWWALAPLHN